MKIVFLDSGLEYDGSTPEQHPLGGSESALVYMARALAKRGHEVRVYNLCPEPGMHEGVLYRHLKQYSETSYLPADAVVASRNPLLLQNFSNAWLRILWLHDAFNQPILEPLHDARFKTTIDQLFFISRWQAWSFLSCYDWPLDRFYMTRNGVCLERFKHGSTFDRGRRMYYSSTPYRGLDLLLDKIFPAIRREVPDVELHVYSSMKVYQMPADQEAKGYGGLYKKLNQPGVHSHGSVSQLELADQVVTHRLLAYPNTFHEVSCITALEAMAAGCVAVTSDQGALPELLEPGGCLIPGVPGSDEYNDDFVHRCVELLRDDDEYREMARQLYDRAHDRYGWDRIAREWEEQLGILLATDARRRAVWGET